MGRSPSSMNSDSQQEAKNCDHSDTKVCSQFSVDSVVLLAKSDCHKLMPHNEYSRAIGAQNSNLESYFISPNQFELVNASRLADCLSSPDQWSGIVLTSTRCIDAVAMSLEDVPNSKQMLLDWSALTIFTVGLSTKEYLDKTLGLPSVGYQTGDSESLARFILEVNQKQRFEKPLLYPCSRLRSDSLLTLLRGQVNLVEVVCYETSVNRNLREHMSEFKSFLEDCLQRTCTRPRALNLIVV